MENEPLAPYTTFKIGGAARYFFVAQSVDDMMRALGAATDCGVPYFILAGGSNILVSDKGFDGLVIFNVIKGFNAELRDGRAVVTAGAGESWDDLVGRCVAEGWAGIECLSGIPGTVGAAPVQNIGAYGQSVGDVVESVEAVDSVSGERVTFNREQCEFGYRTSMFKKARGRYSIARVTLALKVGGAPLLAYHDLKEHFASPSPQSPPIKGGEANRIFPPLMREDKGGGEGTTPTLVEVRRAVIEIRAKKGYVIMPEYESYKTAGSFFMNPIVPCEQFETLQSMVHGCPEPWYWPLSDGRVKVSAACLLQSAGFSKGYRKGKVGISPKHALSIVNFGNASARDVVEFADQIKKAVHDKFEIVLEEEVQFVGF